MKKSILYYIATLILLFSACSAFAQRFWISPTPSNWNNTANWSAVSGGPGGASVPGASDLVTFNALGLGNCTLDVTPTVAGITVNGYTGTIDINGSDLTTTGTNTFTSGSIINGGGIGALTLNTTLTTTFNGSIVSADVNGSTGRILLNGSTFNGTVSITKTDNNNDNSAGNNIFNGTTTLTNFGGGQLLLGNGSRDQFNGVTTFNNYGSFRIYFAHNHNGQTTTFTNDVTLNTLKSGGADPWSFLIAESTNSRVAFGGNLTINCSGALQSNHRILQGTGTAATYGGTLTVNNTNTNAGTFIQLGTVGTSTYNGDIIVSNSGSSGIYFNTTASASSTLADTQIISIGAGGFDSGTLSLIRFTQSGSTPQFLTATGTASLIVGSASVFDGAVSFFAPQIFLNGGTFNDFATIEKTGAGNNTGTGGNTFASNTTINNSGSGQLRTNGGNTFGGPTNIMNNSAFDVLLELTTGSTYNGDVTFSNFGASNVRVAYQGANIFNGNIIVNSTLGTGIAFCELASATTTLNGGSISIGVSGFSSGSLTLPRFTQIGGLTSNLNTFSGTTSLTLGPASSFDGLVDGMASRIFLNGTTFLNNAQFTKTGAGNDNSAGGNIFQLTTFITNSGSGHLLMANTNPDIFNGELNITNTGSNIIYLAHNVAGNQFNGNIAVNATSGSGIYFSNNATGNSTQAALRNISIGGFGFSAGELRIRRLTQLGSEPTNLTLTGASTILRVGPATTFGGTTNFLSPRVFLDGITVNGTATIEKNGDTGDIGAGGNTFQGTTIITNSSSGELVLANTNPDTFNSATTLNNTGTSRIQIGINSAGNSFNAGLTINHGGIAAGAINTIIARNAGSTAAITGNLVLNNTNTDTNSGIIIANDGAVTINGNITVSSTSGRGIFFGNASGSVSQASGFGVSNGTFNIGTLSFSRFTQAGTVASTLNLTGSSILISGTASSFGGNVNFVAPRLFLNGCTYSGTGNFEKTGDFDDAGTGGNIFTGVTTITNSGSRYLLLGNGAADQFLSATTFNNTGSFRIYFAHNHPAQTTSFASDLTLNSNKSGGADPWSYLIAESGASGISVGGNFTIANSGSIRSDFRILNGIGSTGSYAGSVSINITNTSMSTLVTMGENGMSTYNGNIAVSNSGGANGITFNNGAASGSILNGSISSGVFSSGSLNLYRFTQVGVIPENLTLTNGSILRVGPNSSFDGDVNFVAPRLLLNGATYNGTTYLEKNGAGNDAGSGGNIFNGATTLVNSSSGELYMANTASDIFNGALTITNSGSNWIFMSHNVAGTQYNNNIFVNNTGSALGILFSNNASGASTFTNGTITTGGAGFSVGELRLRRFTQVGAIAQNLSLTGSAQLWIGPSSAFDGNVNFVAPRLLLNGATYDGTAYLEKNGATNNDGDGGNVFNQATTIVNSGSAYLRTSTVTADIFNANLILTNSGSSTIRMSDNAAGNQFNGNIEVNSTFGGGIYFGNSAAGTSTLAAGRTIGVGTSGVISGDIRLIRFTQVGPTAQTLNLTGIAILTLGSTSTFNGNVDFRAPQILLNGTTYNGTAYIEKNGATDNPGTGGNIFNGTTSLVDSGSGYLMTANVAPDIFNAALTVTNTGSNIIYLAYNVPGSQFNGNITFNSTLGSRGIYFATTAAGAATIGNGASLLTGGLGFSSGELRFARFTQVGTAAQTLVLTGTSLLRIGPSSTFNGNVDFRSPQFALDGAIYNGTTYLEKTGANNNDSSGGNTFNGSTTIANSGSGFFRFALTALDTFNGDLTLTNTGSSTIRMADNTPGTVFNGNIFVNSTFGGGIYFSESGGGTASLASGRTISVGGLGFSIGELRLRRFTQNGGTPQNLILTGTAGIILGPSIIFNGAVDFRAPQVFINTGSYNSTALIEKTGASDNSGTGSSTFNAATTIRNSGTGFLRTDGNMTFNAATSLINSGSNYLLLELNSGSNYNGDLTLINSGSSNVRMSYQGTSSYNGNIQVNSTSGNGIIFCEIVSASATLANGRTISVGGLGFTAGILTLQRFTQTGGTAQNLVLTGSSTFRSGPSTTWNGSLIVSSPALFLDGSVLNGAINSLIKTGASADSSVGGNSFVGNTTFTNTGTGIFRLANATADDFVGNATFNQASGTIQPAFNIASTFRSNVTVDGASPITFGANNGTITFAGGNAQNVNKSGTASPVFRRLLMNKASNAVTLTTDASVTTNATFTSGVLNTTTTNILTFVNGSTSTGGANASHIDGPVVKVGNAAFSFPTGDGGFFRPISISAPTTNTHAFRAEYFKATQAFGGPATYAAGILTVSSCEYWVLDRTVGASNVNVTLSWNSPDCMGPYITNLPNLRVMRWNGTNWVNQGNGGTTGNATAGTLITSAPITSFSPITLGSTTLDNPLPVELISFTAQVVSENVKLNWMTASELNNDYFTVQRSVDGVEFESLVEIDGAGTKQTATEYEFIDTAPKANISYYRLKQTDFDKTSTYSKVIAINVSLSGELSMYPNPVGIGTPLTLSRKGDYIILNNLGVTVLKVSGVNQIDISSLAPGVYTLRSSAGDTKRLVIQ